MATYVGIKWVDGDGLVGAFGVQAGITAGPVLTILFLGFYGRRLRDKQGPTVFAM